MPAAVRLSVNVNKVATLRNSRGGSVPSVMDAVEACLAAGALGITVHPRADARHITTRDVQDIAARLRRLRGQVEFNIEGDPRPDFIDLVLDVRPDQCTLVPVTPGEITSHAGWPPDAPPEPLQAVVARLHAASVRVSVFIDPDEAAARWAARTGAERVELYTEPYARACERGDTDGRESFKRYAAVADAADAAGLAVNAGHDLDLANLVRFRRLPHLAEVSIGHALVSRALWVGLDRSVREYLDVLAG